MGDDFQVKSKANHPAFRIKRKRNRIGAVVGNYSDAQREQRFYSFYLVQKRSFFSRDVYRIPAPVGQLIREAQELHHEAVQAHPYEASHLEQAYTHLCGLFVARERLRQAWDQLSSNNEHALSIEATALQRQAWDPYGREIRTLRLTDDLSSSTPPSPKLARERQLSGVLGHRKELAAEEQAYLQAQRSTDITVRRQDLFSHIEAEVRELLDSYRETGERLRKAEDLCKKALHEVKQAQATAREMGHSVDVSRTSAVTGERSKALESAPSESDLSSLEQEIMDTRDARREGREQWDRTRK